MTTIPATIQERIALPAVGAPPAGEAAGVSATDVIGILKEKIVVIFFLWLLLGSGAVGLFFLAYFKYPRYTAEALIECITDVPQESFQLGLPKLHEDEHERFVSSQAVYVKTPQVLQKVLQTPEIKATAWYDATEQDQRQPELERELRVGPVKGTNFLRVAISTHDPGDPHVIVSQVVQTYLQEARARATAQYREEFEDYLAELSDLKVRIASKQKQIQDFVMELPAGGVTDKGGVLAERLRLFAEQVTDLELETLQLEGLSNIYLDQQGPGVTPEDREMVEFDPQIGTLAQQQALLILEREVLLRSFGPAHRELKAIDVRLEVNQEQLAILRDQKLAEILDTKAERVRTAFLNAQHALLLRKDKLSEAEAEQSDLDRKLTEYSTLQAELDLLRKTHEQTSQYVDEVQRVVKERNALRVYLAQPPIPPLDRSSPQLLLLPLGVVVSLLLSVGLAIGLDLLDSSVRTPRDVVRYVNTPVLGSVPDIDDEEVEIKCVETAVRDNPGSMIVESFRTIRANLQFSAPAERQRSIAVTSPRPEDGKTTVASNLAAAIANAGRRVLLVDTNFRKPALHRFYHTNGMEGLSNILIGQGQLGDLTCRTDLPNLDLLRSGPIPPNPAELLGSPLMRDALAEASSKYDHVILDTAPVLLASDASVLASMVDGVIVVCRAKQNSRGVVQRACNLLRHVGGHVFGVILNAAQVRRGGYFREQLRTFYEYQLEGEDRELVSQAALPTAGTTGEIAPAPDSPAPPDSVDDNHTA